MVAVVRRGAMAGLATLVLLSAGVPLAGATTTPVGTAGPTPPPIGSAVLAQTLPGFSAVPPGPTNGPLTATEFASQSSNPQQAAAQFAMLSSQPGFGAFIRLWTDRGGPGHGANDLAVLLFRIPDGAEADAFTTGLLVPFDGLHAANPFPVPSVPGAHGYSIQVTTPVDATEQVVVFHRGHYVSMIQLASTTSVSNPTPLTRSEAITVSYQQYLVVGHVDPAGIASTTPPPATRHPAPRPSAPAAATGSSSGLVWLLGLVTLACLAAVVTIAVRRRRQGSPAPQPLGDPWGPHGVFASFGAVDPCLLAVDSGWRGDKGVGFALNGGGYRPAQSVPALVPSIEVEDIVESDPVADPVRS